MLNVSNVLGGAFDCVQRVDRDDAAGPAAQRTDMDHLGDFVRLGVSTVRSGEALDPVQSLPARSGIHMNIEFRRIGESLCQQRTVAEGPLPAAVQMPLHRRERASCEVLQTLRFPENKEAHVVDAQMQTGKLNLLIPLPAPSDPLPRG